MFRNNNVICSWWVQMRAHGTPHSPWMPAKRWLHRPERLVWRQWTVWLQSTACRAFWTPPALLMAILRWGIAWDSNHAVCCRLSILFTLAKTLKAKAQREIFLWGWRFWGLSRSPRKAWSERSFDPEWLQVKHGELGFLLNFMDLTWTHRSHMLPVIYCKTGCNPALQHLLDPAHRLKYFCICFNCSSDFSV